MTPLETKQQIGQTLYAFGTGGLKDNALALFKTLGYSSDRQLDLDPNTAEGLIDAFDLRGTLNADRAMLDQWQTVEFLFQLTADEIGLWSPARSATPPATGAQLRMRSLDMLSAFPMSSSILLTSRSSGVSCSALVTMVWKTPSRCSIILLMTCAR